MRSTLRLACCASLLLAGCANSGNGFMMDVSTNDTPSSMDVVHSMDTSCVAGSSLCDGTCIPTSTDSLNCGACGHACAAGQACVSSVCQATCPTPQTLCHADGGAGVCTLTSIDPANCGACGQRCAAGTACVSGVCSVECPSPEVVCPLAGSDAGAVTCADTSRDALNCGHCGNACPATEACVAGACTLTCPGSQTLCEGSCTNTSYDPNNCGACGTTCALGEACASGVCAGSGGCPGGEILCGSSCTDIETDVANCGACGSACASGDTCTGGACTPPSGCTAPEVMCEFFCTNTATDRSNCGSCSNVCPAREDCESGACECPSTFTMCGTSCTNTMIDQANCGSCSNACPAGMACSAGACTSSAPSLTCPPMIDLGASGTFSGTTCGGDTSWSTACGGTGAPTVFYLVSDPPGGLGVGITTSSSFAVELELPCASGHNGCGVGGLSIGFGGGSVWAIGVQSTTPGACGPFTLDVTVH